MNTVILRTMAPWLVGIMMVFALSICLRGHNEPGGGFIGGLIAAAAMAVLGISAGAPAVRQALRLDPLAIAGSGVLLAAASGLVSAFNAAPYLTAFPVTLAIGQFELAVMTPAIFDIGVFLAVFGSITGVLLGLEEPEGEEP